MMCQIMYFNSVFHEKVFPAALATNPMNLKLFWPSITPEGKNIRHRVGTLAYILKEL
jgi:hypothetical protein